MSDDLFLRIIDRQIKADIVYETDEILAFKDINPQAPVHILVVPKAHIRSLDDLSSESVGLIGRLLLAVTDIARAEGVSEDGYRGVVNCKSAGGQTVQHLHLHLLGGRQMKWPPG